MSQSRRSMIGLWCGVAASALLVDAVTTSADADPISNLVVFGDSSSDLGTQGVARRPTNQGQMWSERLAGNLGLQLKLAREVVFDEEGNAVDVLKPGGSSYAVNGSTVLDFECCLSFRQQIDFFVDDRKRFRGDELVALWFDRNDLAGC